MRGGAAALAVLLACSTAAAAGFSEAARGTDAAEFLGLGAGARAAAMGGAYSAAVDEASAVYWNPAAMTRVRRRSATLMHGALINSGSYDYAAYVQNEGAAGAFGFGAQYFSPGRIAQTNEAGTTVGKLIPYDMALSWSYAREFRGASFGASVKIVDSKIINSSSAGALDLGFLSPALWDGRLRIGVAAVNLGGDTMTFDQVGARLPVTFRSGAAVRLSPSWLTTVDAAFPQSDRPSLALGTEFQVAAVDDWGFFGRGGFNSQTLGSVDGFTGFSMGFGVARRSASVDYGFVPFGGLGLAHRLSVTCAF